MAWFYLFLGFVMFISLVLVHEWGHYIMAKRNGVEVEEFGLGFPPMARKLFIRKGTLFSLNWLPLGGFVKLKGEHDADKSKGSFGAATTGAKTKIMLAGVVMNLATALVLFTGIALTGMPKLLCNQFTVASDTKVSKHVTDEDVVRLDYIGKDTPAEKAGLKEDDQIVSVGDRQIRCQEQLAPATDAYAGKSVAIVVKREGQTITKDVALNSGKPHLGVSSYNAQDGIQLRRSTWSAPIVAVGVTKDFTIATFKGLGTALKGVGSIFAGLFTGNKQARQAGQAEASSQVSGPVGIFYAIYAVAKQGFGIVVFIIAIISLTLAIMNVLPIPALDGGRLFVMLFYRARRKELKKETEERIHGTGFAVLMLLFVIITVVDIRRFF